MRKERCIICTHATDVCGIVAGSAPNIPVCAGCANDVLDAIRQKEEERAAAAEVPATVEEQVLDALKKAETFIVDGTEFGFINLPGTPDPAQETLPAIRDAIAKIREVMAA